MKRVVLVRHGESAWNAEGRVQGQSGTGLSPRGARQAVAAAAELASRYPEANLVSSDLERALETASPLAQALGRAPANDKRFRERSFGAWEGRLRDEVVASDGERWSRWMAGEDVIGEVGGESAVDVADRTEEAVGEILAATDDDGVSIVITHGGVIWHGVHRLVGLPDSSLGGVHNASITVVADYGDHRLRLGTWNATGHLPLAVQPA